MLNHRISLYYCQLHVICDTIITKQHFIYLFMCYKSIVAAHRHRYIIKYLGPLAVCSLYSQLKGYRFFAQ